MKILDIIGMNSGRVVAQADNGFLYVGRSSHSDPFQALKSATLEPEAIRWGAWNVGDENDISELVTNIKNAAIRDHGFPYRSKLTPA